MVESFGGTDAQTYAYNVTESGVYIINIDLSGSMNKEYSFSGGKELATYTTTSHNEVHRGYILLVQAEVGDVFNIYTETTSTYKYGRVDIIKLNLS